MPKFRFTEKLLSYEVNIELIDRLEEYLLTEVPKITHSNINEIKKEFSITLTDELGRETISSIKDYRPSSFPDYTSEVQLSLKYVSPELKVMIRFNESEKYNVMTIEYESDNAREMAISICEGIKRVLSFNKSRNALFHPPDGIQVLMLLGGIFLFIYFLDAYTNDYPRRATLSGGVLTMLLAYVFIGTKIHPYTAFDSNIGRRRKAWSKWFFSGMIGFLIFDVIFLLWLKNMLPSL